MPSLRLGRSLFAYDGFVFHGLAQLFVRGGWDASLAAEAAHVDRSSVQGGYFHRVVFHEGVI